MALEKEETRMKVGTGTAEDRRVERAAKAVRAKKWLSRFKSPFVIVMFLFLAFECFTFIYALFWGLLTSLKSLNNFSEDMFGFPRNLLFSNYGVIFQRLFVTVRSGAGSRRVGFAELLLNSLLYAVIPTFISVVSHAMVAYAACKYRFRFNRVLHFIVVFVIVVPVVGSLGAGLVFARLIGLYDNFPMMAYTAISFADTGFLIWYGVFKGISSEYMEAAKVDGAGHWRIMLTVMFPLVRVPFMILLVLGFIGNWNGYMTQLTMMPSMPNLALALWQFQFDTTTIVSWPTMQIGAAMVVALPCLILFLLFQRWMVGNLTMGGLKG
jgi:multiple sugar transport system permease protein